MAREYVTYYVKRQGDGSWVIIEKDNVKNKLTIHSSYDSKEEADDALTDLSHRPSQAEVLKMFRDLKDSFSVKDIIQ